LGKLDDRGRLVLHGRSKEVIVTTTGENVYPDDVEDLLGQIDHIDEYAIVGLPKAENDVVACIAVPEDTDEPRAVRNFKAMESLRAAIRQRVPRYAQPAVVHLYDADLPKTATRKVKRNAVREILERLETASIRPQINGTTVEGGLAIVQHAVSVLAQRKPEEVVPGLSLTADLGFDSLMAMELSVALEKQIGHALDPDQFRRVETVAELARLVGRPRLSPAALIETDDEEDPLVVPVPVAEAAKRLLGRAQMGFYDRVMKPTVYGRAFVPHNRNAIVVSNHVSHLDMGFVKYALGSYGQEIVSLAAADYFFEGKWKKAYFEYLTNLQAFDRKTNLRQALRETGETIRAGETVLMFPEGTRSQDGQVHEFKATLGHLALSTDTDILPVYLRGTYESWPKGRRIPTRRDISAHIGPPLRIADLTRLTAGMKFRAACHAVSELARAAVVALQRGTVLDLTQSDSLDAAMGKKTEHPLTVLFRELESKYVPGKVDRDMTFYFSLGAEQEAKWTVKLSPQSCDVANGKADGLVADCV
ncbi:MAG: 1-acyl-sn-glycerol-3-phosphate acyltransferase, partial [Myxococcota bacterium]